MLLFYALPVLAMLMRSVAEPGWTPENYGTLAGDSVFRNVFWTTLRTAIAVTSGCLLLGYPVALTLVRPVRTAALALIIVLLPFWTSILVRSYAWMVLLGRRGLLNEALLAGGFVEDSLRILNTSIAVHIAMIHILLPYMILPIANALRQIDPSLSRAALGLGATPFGCFERSSCHCLCQAWPRACCWCSCYRLGSISPPLWSAVQET
jgi:ABC-type spermidine/putrescine transport system permease subunit I